MEFIKIYICDISPLDNEGLYAEAYSSLSYERQKKTDTCKFPDDKKRSVCAGCLLSYALKNESITDFELSFNEYSKPYLKNHKNLHFSLSHSGNYCVCAVSDFPVGIDIEKIKEIKTENIINHFSPDEADYIRNTVKENQSVAFYNIWTEKESYVKFTGKGLNENLQAFSVINNKNYHSLNFNKEYSLSFYSENHTDYKIINTNITEIIK